MNQRFPKKVFVLGAGASKGSEFELPTMDEFFDETLLSTDEFMQLREFLRKYSGNDDPTSVNLEDVMSYLEISLSEFLFLGAPPDEQEMINNIKTIPNILKRYIIRRFPHVRYKRDSKYMCKKHKALFDTLQPQDTVITLNYDIVADYTLEKSEDDKEIPTSDRRLSKLSYYVQEKMYVGSPPTLRLTSGLFYCPGYYIKLHGSISWVHCPNPRCIKHDYINFHQFWWGEADENDPQPGQPCPHCGSSFEILIIPPTFTKRIEAISKLQLLWNLARREIFDADEIILIGVSLAPSDFLLRWLLKHATTPIREKGKSSKVIVVNPCTEHQERTKQVMATDIVPHNTIEEYLNSLKEHENGQ